MEPVVNKVKKSGLITIDLETYLDKNEIVEFDLKDYLHMELLLKEKEFRQALDEHDWSQYDGKYIAVFCSTDAIVASWAYMLVAAHARKHAKDVLFGTKEEVAEQLFKRSLDQEDWEQYRDQRVLLKGCSDHGVPPGVYLYATQKLLPLVDRLMYGEACSFVPVYRKPKEEKKAEQTG